jgi:hypothetical protein
MGRDKTLNEEFGGVIHGQMAFIRRSVLVDYAMHRGSCVAIAAA